MPTQKNNLSFGLPQKTIDDITIILAKHTAVSKAIIYGSRAMDNYRKGSDIDITLLGTHLTSKLCNTIAAELDNLPMLYSVDVSVYDLLNHAKLKDHIDEHGKVFYDRYAGWQTVKLGEVCEVLDNLRKPITRRDRISGHFPYYGATGIVDWIHDYIFDEKLVLVGEDGAKWGAGDKTAFIATGKYWVNNHAHVLRPKPNVVLHEWIAYQLTAMDLNNFITGLTVPKLNQSQLKQIPILLPPLPEQQRIVAKLDAAFAEIDESIKTSTEKINVIPNLSSNLIKQNLTDDSYFWNTENLSNLATNLDSKRVPITKSKRVKGTTPYYGASGIVDYVDDHIFDEELLLVSEDGANLLARTYPIAFSISGKTWVNNHAHVLKFENQKIQKWVEYYLNTTDLSPFISGMAQPKLNQKKLYEIPIPCPKIDFLDKLLSEIESTASISKELLELENKKLSQFILLKSAILSQELQPSEAA